MTEPINLLKRKLRINRDGVLMKDVYEIYLRNDIPCGWNDCELCSSEINVFEFEASKYLFIPDYDLLVNYYDVFMNSSI